MADLNTKYMSLANELNPTNDGLAAIKQSLERLLKTPKGHNPFNREYGSSLYDLLFNNVVDIQQIPTFLYMDITKWEPRVTLSPMDISITQININTYQVDCVFIFNNTLSGISTEITKE